MSYLKRLSLNQWAWIHFQLALGVVWALLMMWNAPYVIQESLRQPLITLWMSVTMIGALISMAGLIMKAQEDKIQTLGVSVELIGLILLTVGPAVFFVTQISSLFTEPGIERLTSAGFTYAMCAVLAYRFACIVPVFRKEARDETKGV